METLAIARCSTAPAEALLTIGVRPTARRFGIISPSAPAASAAAVEKETSLAKELEEILSCIQGAGKVQVMLTVAKGEEIIYQTDGSTAESGGRQDTVVITDENRTQSGLVQQSIPPTYRGAIVVCQGADSPAVCLAVKEAVSKVTGLDTSQISVLKMK